MHFFTPIEPKQVLDVGTGTGIWAIECADRFPSAVVTGIDLSPIQPPWIPSNCKFQLADVSEDWTFQDNFFDRDLMGAIADYTSLYQQTYRCTKPGGWIKYTEVSAEIFLQGRPIPDGYTYASWNNFIRQAGEKTGKTFNPIAQSVISIKEAGWVDVETEEFRIPIGRWPLDPQLKWIGTVNRRIRREGLHRFAFRLGIIMSLSEEEMYTLVENTREAFRVNSDLAFYK